MSPAGHCQPVEEASCAPQEEPLADEQVILPLAECEGLMQTLRKVRLCGRPVLSGAAALIPASTLRSLRYAVAPALTYCQ